MKYILKTTILLFLLQITFLSFSQNNKVEKSYYRDSIVSYEAWYGKDNLKDSVKTYYNTGSQKEVFYFDDNDKIHGICFQFDQQKNKMVEWKFKHGKLKSRKDFLLDFNKKNKAQVRKNINTLKSINEKTNFNPKSLKDFYIRAGARMRLENTFLALLDFQKVERFLNQKSESIEVSKQFKSNLYDKLGSTYATFENKNLAISYKLKAIQFQPHKSVYKYNLGSFFYQIKEYQLAISYLERVIAKNKNHDFANWIFGAIYSDLEQYEKALKHINIAIDREDHLYEHSIGKAELDLRTIRGLVYHKLGETEKGILDLKEALNINKNNSFAHRNLGVVYYENKEYDLACTHLQKAKELNYEKKHDRNDLNIFLESACNKKEIVLIQKDKQPFIYPNPTKDILYIKNYDEASFNYKIYNHYSKLIQKGVSSETSFNISSLPKGLYILKISDLENKESKSFKIIKE